MKKLIIITILSLLLFVGCSKYQVEKPDLTPEEIQKFEQNIKESKEKLEKPDITNTEKVESLQILAVSYERLGNYGEAIDYHESILEIAAGNFLALNNLAAIYEEVGEYELALKYIAELHKNYATVKEVNQQVVGDTIRILVKNEKFEDAKKVLEGYARNFQDQSTAPFISEQFEYIARMQNASETKK